MLCVSLNGRGAWGRMDTCIRMAESLHCSPETITVLLISLVMSDSLRPHELQHTRPPCASPTPRVHPKPQYKLLLVLEKKINLINKIIFQDGKHHCRK